jgi:hypothetical protein
VRGHLTALFEQLMGQQEPRRQGQPHEAMRAHRTEPLDRSRNRGHDATLSHMCQRGRYLVGIGIIADVGVKSAHPVTIIGRVAWTRVHATAHRELHDWSGEAGRIAEVHRSTVVDELRSHRVCVRRFVLPGFVESGCLTQWCSWYQRRGGDRSLTTPPSGSTQS